MFAAGREQFGTMRRRWHARRRRERRVSTGKVRESRNKQWERADNERGARSVKLYSVAGALRASSVLYCDRSSGIYAPIVAPHEGSSMGIWGRYGSFVES